ncbi:acyltransferase family protein [Bifidobacterium sp. ESL0745]|uniref:acyltransferase family protein n=1 Tax=Bifidobacterium sp. ESL0745 TaxID=2983226 RepID=UPI0023F7CF7A|nr:acyltransferase family protein [Bifidobacterium sp. ESL0745]MDF7666214.1 acyltransferase family protein [Bifidobacterium sp. ESL0745]
MTSSSISASRPASAKGRRPRIFAIELLRLLAIVGIATFHTFLLTFEQIAVNGPHAVLAAAQAGATPSFFAIISSAPLAVWLISMLMFLGAWGNHIFFMISAFFLVPRLAQRSRHKGFPREEWKPTALRIAKVLAAVVFYVVVLMVVNRWIVPIQAVGGLRDVILSLEFVWLYVLFVLLAPFIGWCIERCRKKWCVALWVLALAVIYGLNVYVAISGRNFFDSLSILDWRKQMSALTYFASYICAGALGCAWQRWYGHKPTVAGNSEDADNGNAAFDSSESNTYPDVGRTAAYPNKVARVDGRRRADSAGTHAPMWLTRRFWATALIALILVAGCIVAFAAFGGHFGLLMVLSFKSTSAFSFLFAVCSLMCAACPSARAQKRSLLGTEWGLEHLPTGDTKSDDTEYGARILPGNATKSVEALQGRGGSTERPLPGIVTESDGTLQGLGNSTKKPLWSSVKAFCRRAVEALASGILGFYIVQALTYYSWIALQNRFADPVAAHVASAFAVGGMSASSGWLVEWFVVEVVFSLVFVLVVCLIDRFIRQPLLRLIKLA